MSGLQFYNYNEIKDTSDCLQFATDALGMKPVKKDRFNVEWRAGSNSGALAINRKGWFDHVTKDKGSVIDLCANMKFNGNVIEAQMFLGEYYGLMPTRIKLSDDPIESSSAYDAYIKKGYKEICRYRYKNEHGRVIHSVVRLEHAEEGKEFLQCTPQHWGLGDVKPILYNLKQVIDSEYVIICEGEKDADMLIEHGLVATTACGGVKKWDNSFNKYFKDKDIAILPDNDDVGEEHAFLIATLLFNYARKIKIVKTSNKPKGDVSDYIEEGHKIEDVTNLISSTVPLQKTDLLDVSDIARVKAKEANGTDFLNYTLETHIVNDAEVIKKKPRHIKHLIKDIHARFLVFPRRIGEELFDHDKDTEEIRYIRTKPELFAWVQLKSKRPVGWMSGEKFASKEELLGALTSEAIKYDSISHVPEYPMRKNVYYTCKQVDADSEYKYFNEFIEMFCLASDDYIPLLKAFVASPLYHENDIERPSWIIDSEQGPGSGKTTLVEIVAKLYKCYPVRTNMHELTNTAELEKRLLSSVGRQSKIVLLDNVTGNFSSSKFADLVTAKVLSGRPAYARGEEVRPNNLTYVITANSATVDNDIAKRSFYIFLNRPKYNVTWLRAIYSYIESYRENIFADMIAILKNNPPLDVQVGTRFPIFEEKILQPFCRDVTEYEAAIDTIKSKSSESNLEEELAKEITEDLRFNIQNLGINPDEEPVFIRTQIIEIWRENNRYVKNTVQQIRNLAKQGYIEQIDPKIRRYPFHGKNIRSGIFWNYHLKTSSTTIKVIGKKSDGTIGIIY
jgi:5S rRNA maturation endonuclease (ribonuclease M5)